MNASSVPCNAQLPRNNRIKSKNSDLAVSTKESISIQQAQLAPQVRGVITCLNLAILKTSINDIR